MQLDPLISLAFAMHENPGVYALLLGSGVSRDAGIPTGWGIVLRLLAQLAAAEQVDPGRDLVAWYRERYTEEPRYDDILSKVAKTPAERRQTLSQYFEPSEDDEEGAKMPRAAHRAIARLARGGYVRMILTTNFDTLLETALRDEGVEPVVISTDDGLKGARPIIHSRCMVVKLHGDYRDDRIRNTEEELREYSKPLNAFLDRVLDEFGLIVCGWSAEYDVALRKSLRRSRSRRYTTYWAAYLGQLDEQAELVVKHRDAVVINIESADAFFDQIADKAEALERLKTPHPLSIEAAVATAKRYLEDPEHNRVKLEELVTEEVQRILKQVRGGDFPPFAPQAQELFEEWKRQLGRYESLTEPLLHLLVTVAWFDKGESSHLLAHAIERLAETPRQTASTEALSSLRLYPALRAIYAAGIASVATLQARRFVHLGAILVAPVARIEDRRGPILREMTPPNVLNYDLTKQLYGGNVFLPPNEHLFNSLRGVLARYTEASEEYLRAFNLFETIFALVHADMGLDWPPGGAFIYRQEAIDACVEIVSDVAREQRDSSLLKAGLFGGDPARFRASLTKYQSNLREYLNDLLRRFRRAPLIWPNLTNLYDEASK